MEGGERGFSSEALQELRPVGGTNLQSNEDAIKLHYGNLTHTIN